MTIWTDNAHRFASRAEDAIDAARHAGVRAAVKHLRAGDYAAAHAAVETSFAKQVRLAGLERKVKS